MKKFINNAKKHSKNESSAAKSQERNYIKDYLTDCVESHARYNKILGVNSKWIEISDFETRVFKQVIELIHLSGFFWDLENDEPLFPEDHIKSFNTQMP